MLEHSGNGPVLFPACSPDSSFHTTSVSSIFLRMQQQTVGLRPDCFLVLYQKVAYVKMSICYFNNWIKGMKDTELNAN